MHLKATLLAFHRGWCTLHTTSQIFCGNIFFFFWWEHGFALFSGGCLTFYFLSSPNELVHFALYCSLIKARSIHSLVCISVTHGSLPSLAANNSMSSIQNKRHLCIWVCRHAHTYHTFYPLWCCCFPSQTTREALDRWIGILGVLFLQLITSHPLSGISELQPIFTGKCTKRWEYKFEQDGADCPQSDKRGNHVIK